MTFSQIFDFQVGKRSVKIQRNLSELELAYTRIVRFLGQSIGRKMKIQLGKPTKLKLNKHAL